MGSEIYVHAGVRGVAEQREGARRRESRRIFCDEGTTPQAPAARGALLRCLAQRAQLEPTTMVAGVSLLIALQLFSRLVTFALNAVLARSLGRDSGTRLTRLQGSSCRRRRSSSPRRACGARAARASTRAAAGRRWAAPSTSRGRRCAARDLRRGGRRDVGAASSATPRALVSAAELRWAVWTVCVRRRCSRRRPSRAGWYAQANEGLLSRRVIAEGAALALKAALTAWLALRVGAGAAAFAYAQLAFAGAFGALLLALLRRARAPLRELLPRRAAARRWRATSALWRRRCCGSAPVRADRRRAAGDRALTGMTEQGVYALVSNLGSLVARLVLQPVEEATFAHYSRLAAAAPPDAAALRRMVARVRAAAIFGGVFAAFGPAYSWLLLPSILAGRCGRRPTRPPCSRRTAPTCARSPSTASPRRLCTRRRRATSAGSSTCCSSPSRWRTCRRPPSG